MKVLQNAGIVFTVKDGKWQHYSLQKRFVQEFKQNTDQLLAADEHCLCQRSDCEKDVAN
ncbi:hypothetical protein FC07_GL002927 [Loigolactobacillus bifermentans DSM 20003]|uniref:HTH arsR-type domain-containing protein n=2 Tax=Loigolactobacillus bifermentans TaxID=1607 RepID=A0A0R1GY34_9LACO|nr:hypothetical protein FC07_GL002927 [Loigolactobacillus bifermentans DSM 20003]